MAAPTAFQQFQTACSDSWNAFAAYVHTPTSTAPPDGTLKQKMWQVAARVVIALVFTWIAIRCLRNFIPHNAVFLMAVTVITAYLDPHLNSFNLTTGLVALFISKEFLTHGIKAGHKSCGILGTCGAALSLNFLYNEAPRDALNDKWSRGITLLTDGIGSGLSALKTKIFG